MRTRWTLKAANDLCEIARFIAFDNPLAASTMVKKIRKSVKRLARHPKSGRVVPEFGNEFIREVLIGNYRVVYRIERGALSILTVFEGHRLMPIDEKDVSSQ